MSVRERRVSNPIYSKPDWSAYAGWWVALAAGQIVGVGKTKQEAYLAAKGSRPKEEPIAVLYVPTDEEGSELGSKVAPSVLEHNALIATVRDILLQSHAKAYLVGGSVRDYVMERACHDLDFAVPSQALELGRKIAHVLRAAFYVLDPERETARVVVTGAHGERIFVDIATLNGGTIEADLAARDFTINAMAVDLTNWHLLDPYAGRTDLSARRLRLVSEQGIAQDPIRALRGVRLAAELGLTLEPETERILARDGKMLEFESAERVRDELVRILALPNATEPIRRLEHLDLLPCIAPELVALKGVTQSAPHQFDVWEHTLLTVVRLEHLLAYLVSEAGALDAWVAESKELWQTLEAFRPTLRQHLEKSMADQRPRWVMLKLAALVHDVGKPACRQVESSGRVRFIGHDARGSEIAVEMARRLRFASAEVEWLRTVVRHHMRPILLAQRGIPITPRIAHRYYRDTGLAGLDIALLALADVWALGPEPVRWRTWLPLAGVVSFLLQYRLAEDSPETWPPLVTGHDLMAACGLAAGPEVGKWLRLIREAQVSGKLTSREEALQWVLKSLGKKEESPSG